MFLVVRQDNWDTKFWTNDANSKKRGGELFLLVIIIIEKLVKICLFGCSKFRINVASKRVKEWCVGMMIREGIKIRKTQGMWLQTLAIYW